MGRPPEGSGPPGTTGGNSVISSLFEAASLLEGLIAPGGTTTAQPNQITGQEIPGDLGSVYSDSSQDALVSMALRRSAAENFFRPRNHRYRGVREAWKFNLAMQQLMTLVAYTYTILKTKYANLKISETIVLPTEAELAVIYHCREQVRFQEWIVQKDDDKEWFE